MSQSASNKGRILVMDDEEMVRSLLKRMLERLGYRVAFAEEGAEAVDTYRQALQDNDPFTAVIMDLTVPQGMGGKEAIFYLKEIDPDVKAIVSSGYAGDAVMSDYRSYGFSAMVAKPYRVQELEEILQQVLHD